ncbi:zinc finger protein 260-like isoform X1 [Bradysia coprophila]|uniref:zinc finger protein 260-like isoform X1 n=1 Tax=Bradysia coprophila TaxID=38358 RepID=UPI00187DA10D|nr:zinc finger protein 260-like isoform X1 [Bradysia coprophila]
MAVDNSETTFILHETCRLCLLNIDQLHGMQSIPIFTDRDDTPEAILNEFNFLKLKLAQNDGLPQQICDECLKNLLNIRAFRTNCERSQDVLEKFFKPASESTTSATVPIKLIADLSESNFSDFEFLNIDNVEDNVEYEMKIEVVAVDESIVTGEIECTDESKENCSGDSELVGEDTENVDETSSCMSSDSTHDDSDNIECSICGKIYKRKAHLLRHLMSHKNKTDSGDKVSDSGKGRHCVFVCNKCGKRFSKSKNLQNHVNDGGCVKEENPQCRFCKETFSSIGDLEIHLEKVHPPHRPHMCPICKKTFQSVSNRNTHLQSHNKDDTYKCSDCGQGFKSKVYLNKHKKSVHTRNEHDCPHCSMKFFNTTKFEYHLKSHDENKKYKCKYCDKSFLQHHHLANHERIHTNVRPFLCNICGKDFKQECNFKLHLRIHSGLRPYVCSVCGKDFIQRGSFVMHMKQHSGVRPYQCEHCGKDFIQKSSLTVHLRTHTGERPFKCDSCDRAFVQAQQLKYHRHSAHGGPSLSKKEPPPKPSSDGRIYPYCCSLCNKGFKLPSSLSSHMKIHNEERKHVCSQCGNSFKRAEHLRIHINGVHLKKKPYTCEYCPKTFAQSGDRNIHRLRHTHEKNHQCTYCMKMFRLPKALRAHCRIHTGERPYTCEFCQMDFMTYTALATHTMKHENVLSAEAPSVKDELKAATIPLGIITASDSNLVLTLTN